jgi:hypothetical protein
MEEIISPKVLDFSKSTDNGYTETEIIAMEKDILKTFQWLTCPPTLSMWANWYMSQWDCFISDTLPLTFKAPCQSSYEKFREVFLLID